MAVAARKARVKVSGSGVAFTNEATTVTGGRTIFTISNAAKTVWDPSATITVEQDDGLGGAYSAASGGYTVNRLTGAITFAVAKASGILVRTSGTYLPLSVAAEAKQYSHKITGSIYDDTEFEDTWKTKVPGIKSISGSLSQWFSVDTYFHDALLAGSPVVLELYSDSSLAADVRAWVLLDSVGIQAVVDGLVDRSVTFTGASDADGRQVSA